MSQPLLQLKGRDTLLCFIGRKRVSERVAACPFGNPGVFAVFHHELSDAALRNGLSLIIQEEDDGQIIFERLHTALLKLDFPFCVAFAPYFYRRLEVIEEFAYSQYGTTYNGGTDGFLRPACKRTIALISAAETSPALIFSRLSKSRVAYV
jgi:hypothetical protein